MINLAQMGLAVHPLGLLLAVLFISLMLILFRWMFAVPSQTPMEVVNVESTLSNLHRIVVPLVESVCSERAVELACRMASDEKSEIILVAVVTVPLSLALNANLPALEEHAQRAIDTGRFIVRQHKLKCETRIVRNRTAAEGIRQVARELDADVIVMGTGIPRQRTPAEVSKTAMELLRLAPCEVIVAQAPLSA